MLWTWRGSQEPTATERGWFASNGGRMPSRDIRAAMRLFPSPRSSHSRKTRLTASKSARVASVTTSLLPPCTATIS